MANAWFENYGPRRTFWYIITNVVLSRPPPRKIAPGICSTKWYNHVTCICPTNCKSDYRKSFLKNKYFKIKRHRGFGLFILVNRIVCRPSTFHMMSKYANFCASLCTYIFYIRICTFFLVFDALPWSTTRKVRPSNTYRESSDGRFFEKIKLICLSYPA